MNPTIVCRAGACAVVHFAANELADYLSRMTGGNVPVADTAAAPAIRLEVAADDPALEPMDSFQITESNRVVTLRSATPRGLLMAAYHYLQLLGCRFHFPGKQNEFVPKRDEVILPGARLLETPAFRKRGIVMYYRNSAFADWIDYMPKVKLNTLGVHAFLGTTQADRGSLDDLHRATAMAAERGLRVDLEAHCFGEVLCASDRAAMAEAEAHMAELVRGLPGEVHDLFLWQADGYIKKCECPEHQGQSVPDQTLMFVNHMLGIARQVRPGERLCYLAYINTLPAPRNVRPANGVFLEWAPIRRCMSHALNDRACPVNADEHVPHLLANLDVFPADEAQVLGYWLDSSLFNRGRFAKNRGRLPWFPQILQADLRYYRGLGFRDITTFACQLDGAYVERFISPAIPTYARLLWNPDADWAADVPAFCESFFGTQEAEAGLVVDAAVDPNHCPAQAEVEARIDAAMPVIDGLVRDASEDLHRERLRRLRAELEHRQSWRQA